MSDFKPDLPDPTSLTKHATPDQLAQLHQAGEDAKQWGINLKKAVVDECRARDLKQLRKKKILYVQGARKISDSKQLFRAARAFGLTDEEVADCCKFYITRLEAIIREKQEQKDHSVPITGDLTWDDMFEIEENGTVILQPEFRGLTIEQKVALFHYITADATYCELGYHTLR